MLPPCGRERPPVAEAQERLGRLREAARQRHEADLECARQLAWFWEHHAWYEAGCAAPAELAERCGLAGEDARGLIDLGLALRVEPRLEQEVREGAMSSAAAVLVASVVANPSLQRPGDDWLHLGRTTTTWALRRHVHRRREEARTGGEPVVPLHLYVRLQAREDFGRARTIASRKAGYVLTRGATFETLVDAYLDEHDPGRVRPGSRRVPPT